MAYPLYESGEFFWQDSKLKSSWYLSVVNDLCNMEDNGDDYFGWNCLKINEEGYENSAIGKSSIRKRKLTVEDNNNNQSEENKIRHLDDINSKNSLSLEDKDLMIKKNPIQNGTSRMPHWQVDDIADLNADIDSSLSLGSELTPNTYNVGESILSLSGLTVFKQEAPSPTNNDALTAQMNAQQHRQTPQPSQKGIMGHSGIVSIDENASRQSMISSTINQLFGQTSGYGSMQNGIDSSNLVPSTTPQDVYNVSSTNNYDFTEDGRFQYVLAAATSIATKVNEDTLTYLNQGQSYEIKLKKLGDLSMYKGKMLKSIIRICFHERRLQYMEKEQMTAWQRNRPGDRILEVDVPLSYGVFDIVQPANAINIVQVSWDPTKEVGVYIKVNCISTEFTPKKHGGEKGVPFRIQVETSHNGEGIDSRRLHAAACQIKVFKLKGADRKHKQDREKIMKRPISEQDKYQPSYECTVLNDIPNEAILMSSPMGPTPPLLPSDSGPPNSCRLPNNLENDLGFTTPQDSSVSNSPILHEGELENKVNSNKVVAEDQLLSNASPLQTVEWLTKNRFEKFIQTFVNFSGADMLRLCRNDLIQICGNADGIRLYNALHSKMIVPKLKIFVCREKSSVFNAVYLSAFCSFELMKKLASLINIPAEKVRNIYMEGPQSIHVQMNNDVVKHMKEDSMFSLDIIQENSSYIFVLKQAANS